MVYCEELLLHSAAKVTPYSLNAVHGNCKNYFLKTSQRKIDGHKNIFWEIKLSVTIYLNKFKLVNQTLSSLSDGQTRDTLKQIRKKATKNTRQDYANLCKTRLSIKKIMQDKKNKWPFLVSSCLASITTPFRFSRRDRQLKIFGAKVRTNTNLWLRWPCLVTSSF